MKTNANVTSQPHHQCWWVFGGLNRAVLNVHRIIEFVFLRNHTSSALSIAWSLSSKIDTLCPPVCRKYDKLVRPHVCQILDYCLCTWVTEIHSCVSVSPGELLRCLHTNSLASTLRDAPLLQWKLVSLFKMYYITQFFSIFAQYWITYTAVHFYYVQWNPL